MSSHRPTRPAVLPSKAALAIGDDAVDLLALGRALLRERAPPSCDAIVSVDDDDRICAFNGGAEATFGWVADEILGQPFCVLLPAGERVSGGPSLAVDRRLALGLRKSGEEFPLQASIWPAMHDGRRLLTAIVRDISEEQRRGREQDLLAELGAALLRGKATDDAIGATIAELAIVHDFADGCMVDFVDDGVDVTRVVHHRQRALQPACELLCELPLDRHRPHLTRDVLALGRPLLIGDVDEVALEALAQTPEHLALLLRLHIRSLMVVPLLARGHALGAIAFFSGRPGRFGPRDVVTASEIATRAAFAVDNARLYRAAQSAIAARDRVLTIVAHDLRSPLMAVRLQIDELQEEGPALDRRSQKPAKLIGRAVRRMENLIQDMLDIARLEAGALHIECGAVPARGLIDEVCEAQQSLAERAALRLDVEVRPDPCDVWAQRDRVLRVFDNLIGNALKFTARGGRISLGGRPDGLFMRFWVSDNGKGIASDQLEHVFEQYWQAGADRRGVGMGLTIAKGIVEAHGGRIWVESQLSIGTTFFFTLPLVPRDDERQAVAV